MGEGERMILFLRGSLIVSLRGGGCLKISAGLYGIVEGRGGGIVTSSLS